MNKINKQTLIHNLEAIHNTMREADDLLRASTCDELANKIEQGLLNVALCGHFSAGKTSLINHLCGTKLLPSSPIPTSANVVFIRNGEAGAMVKLTGDRGHERVAISELEQYAANGADIEQIDIAYPISLLGEQLALLDTPGIDSTDEQHLVSTQSALHLADVVLYVMDYNHVQSEINLNFIKRLQNMGKPLYLLVNQIDKHNEAELSFARFRDDVIAAFHTWDIKPVDVLFISVRDEQTPHNELYKLKALIELLSKRSIELQQMSVKHTMSELIHDHVRSLAEQQLQRQGDGITYEALLQAYNEQQEKLTHAKHLIENTEREFKQAIRQLLDNANVTPALTRDLANDYIVSRDPKFRVSLFATAKKNEAEIQKRLSRWHADINAQIKAQITWHLQQLLREQVGQAGIKQADAVARLEERIAQLEMNVSEQWLAQKVHKGAVYNAEYTMNYTRDIAIEVKNSFRREAYVLTDQLMEMWQAGHVEEIEQQQAELDHMQLLLEFFRYEQRLLAHIDDLPDQIELPIAPQLQPLTETTRHVDESVKNKDALAVANSSAHKHGEELSHFKLDPFDENKSALRNVLVKSSQSLQQAAHVVADLPTMQAIAQAMQERAARLAANQFTIALFGAFSAGKSSLANALLGHRIMPVSPHPTTAAVNIVRAPLDGEQHGTANVTMKTREAITAEVVFALQQLGQPCHSLEEALQQIKSLRPEDIGSKGKPYYTFLQAVEQGWEQAENQLGQMLTVELDEFNLYAASETHACFVAQIELIYESSFTEAGFILVDTPGADSINSRHTDLAFNYIKNADMLLFVTYYNHAFSQADRLFLNQLGSVKDSFALDKMFFLINAADLASSEQELEQVTEHVEEQLLAHGIRKPRLYAISSKLAMQGKETADELLVERSGMRHFEQDFMSFFRDELVQLAINSANNDISYATHVLDNYRRAAEAEEQGQASKIKAWHQARADLASELKQLTFASERHALEQEISEQLHYVRQRLTYRFAEWYHLAFNPADLRDDVPNIRQALGVAYDELVHMVEKSVQQEVLAVTLRLENAINKMLQVQFAAMNDAIKQRIDAFEALALEPVRLSSPKIKMKLSHASIDVTMLYRHFRQPKYFFEGEGKKRLLERLESHLFDPLHHYFEEQLQQLQAHYKHELINHMEMLVSMQVEQMTQFVMGMMTMLDNRANSANIEGMLKTLHGLQVK